MFFCILKHDEIQQKPRKLSLNNSLDLQMQKEALEHHKKMLDNQLMQQQQPNNLRFYGATTQQQQQLSGSSSHSNVQLHAGSEIGGGSRIYENTATSVTLTPKLNTQSQQHIGYDGLIYSNIIHDQDGEYY
jgi:hypothetical protein